MYGNMVLALRWCVRYASMCLCAAWCPFESKVELGPLVFWAKHSGGLEPAQDLRFRQAHVVKDQMTVGATSQGPGLQPRFSVSSASASAFNPLASSDHQS
jgi:hypothetical protein